MALSRKGKAGGHSECNVIRADFGKNLRVSRSRSQHHVISGVIYMRLRTHIGFLYSQKLLSFSAALLADSKMIDSIREHVNWPLSASTHAFMVQYVDLVN